jgi:cytochrome c biogenesis protein CcmG/thiol:disulfide interchange protein DsbE
VNRNTVVLIVVILAVTLMLIGGRYLNQRGGMAGGTGALAGADIKGVEAPDFELKALDGKTVKLSDLRGKAVLLNFWATWCGPCKVEMPWLVDLQKKYGEQGLQIVGIAMEDDPAPVEEFTKNIGVNYTILMGKNAVGDAYSVLGLPTTYYIDRSGKILDRHIGLVSLSEIEEHIKTSLASQAAGHK